MTERAKLSNLAPNTATIICCHLFKKERELCFVGIDQDGEPMMSCNERDHITPDDWHVVGLGHLMSYYPFLSDLPEMAEGTGFERSNSNDPWLECTYVLEE